MLLSDKPHNVKLLIFTKGFRTLCALINSSAFPNCKLFLIDSVDMLILVREGNQSTRRQTLETQERLTTGTVKLV